MDIFLSATKKITEQIQKNETKCNARHYFLTYRLNKLANLNPGNTKEQEFIKRVNASQGIIHKVCRMYCDDSSYRKDLAQEILIQLWKSYPSYRGEASFSSWMYRVALNVAIQFLKKEKKRKLLFLTVQEFKEVIDPDLLQEQAEKTKRMYQLIGQLDQLEKAIILLHLEGHPPKEIAGVVGITPNYVRVKINRIKKKMAKKLS